MGFKPAKNLKPPDHIKCGGAATKCVGAKHDHTCPVYVWALENWDVKDMRPVLPKKRKPGHHPKPGEARMTPEQKAEIVRTNGQRGGRPPSPMPHTLLEVLKKGKFRVKDEFRKGDEVSEAASGLAGWAMERLAYVAAGRIVSRKAPSVVKAAQGIREEICEPIEKTMIHKGGIDLGRALDSVNAPRPSDAEPAVPTTDPEKVTVQ